MTLKTTLLRRSINETITALSKATSNRTAVNANDPSITPMPLMETGNNDASTDAAPITALSAMTPYVSTDTNRK
jgi:hypothetical protein